MTKTVVKAPDKAVWRMPAFLRVSAGVHAAAVLTAAAQPHLWPLALGAIAANQAAIGAAVLCPTSSWLGPNIVRLPAAAAERREIALTFDDGPNPDVTPLVLDLLDRHNARASFFCSGARVERHRDLAREIVARGHRIENHSYWHRHTFAMLGLRGYERELRRAQEAILAATGRAPQFFRAPAGLRNPFLDPVLNRLGLRLCSWTRRGFDTATRDPKRVAARLLDRLTPGDIVLLHDGNCARTVNGTAVVIEVLPRVLDACAARGLIPVRVDQACSGSSQ
jgi:peptidoglycan/xylan/chitin deacetylase (PgdA/CDA1 family)